MEAMIEAIGNGLVQYGKDDCTFTDGQYHSYLNFPSGITFGDIILMRVRQYAYSNTSWLCKKDDTTVSGSSEYGVSPSATAIELSFSLSTGTAASVVEVAIITKK